MTPQRSNSRWLARHVIVDGVDYRLAIVDVVRGDDGWSVNVSAFERETPSTSYHGGVLRITTNEDPRVEPTLEFL